MTLASMMALDENALICDLAETYQIYDYRSLPVFTVAALSAGLRENSRIMTEIRGGTLVSQEYCLALIYDILAAFFTGGNADSSLSDLFDGRHEPEKKPDKKTRSYDTPEDFERDRRKAMGID